MIDFKFDYFDLQMFTDLSTQTISRAVVNIESIDASPATVKFRWDVDENVWYPVPNPNASWDDTSILTFTVDASGNGTFSYRKASSDTTATAETIEVIYKG